MTSQEDPNITYLEFKTPHYTFQMKITKKEETHECYHFIVGDDKQPCLEGIILLSSNSLYNNKTTLIKLDALEECAIEDINQEYSNVYTFGKEMLDVVIFFINSQFPSIKTIRLNDTSYIPYKKDTGDTLDLLTYSIGLYKKTWYEERINAYILPKENHDKYRQEVEEYASKHTKDEIPFYHIYHTIATNNVFAADIIKTNMQMYEEMYEESETFPEFFQRLSKTIKREEKCRFFKGWLNSLINSKITVTREWNFDIYPKITMRNHLSAVADKAFL
jgi:hypothetical protein